MTSSKIYLFLISRHRTVPLITVIMFMLLFPLSSLAEAAVPQVTMPPESISAANVKSLGITWIGSVGGSVGSASPLVANGFVYLGSSTGTVYAFPSQMSSSCTASIPANCSPSFSMTPVTGSPILTTPVIFGTTLFISSGDRVFAYDANGVTNCSGTPLVCSPLWSTFSSGGADISTPLLNGSRLYVHDSSGVYAYDANGITNCSGTPIVCSPLWTGMSGNDSPLPPAILGNTVFTTSGGMLYAYDANGITNCSGTPIVCSPLWTGIIPGPQGQAFSPITVSGGELYLEGFNSLIAYDANGITNCSGTPIVCSPLWTGVMTSTTDFSVTQSKPAIVNGIVYEGSTDHRLYLFSVGGGCQGVGLSNCNAITSIPMGGSIESSPVVIGDSVYLGSDDGYLNVLTNPAIILPVTGSALQSIQTSPLSLSPAFSPTVTDYVFSCQSGLNSISLSLSAQFGSLNLFGTTGSTVSVTIALYPNQALVITAPDPLSFNGATQEYWIRCLPPNFPSLNVARPGNPAPGYYLTGAYSPTSGFSGMYSMILNNYGIPVWYDTGSMIVNASSPDSLTVPVNPNSGSTFFDNTYGGSWVTKNLATKTLTSLSTPGYVLDNHALIHEQNGNYLVIAAGLSYGFNLTALGYSSNYPYEDCYLQEFNPQGQLVWQWNAATHVSPAESVKTLVNQIPLKIEGVSAADIYHCNSIDLSANGADILLSMRNTSAIYEIDRATGKILFKLSGNSIVSDGEKYLQIKGDPESETSGQHDARFQPNGDISCYDDHTELPGPSRGVEYNVNLVSNTATMVWEYVNPEGVSSYATGSFRRYDGGNDNVIGWGMAPGAGFSEVDASGNLLMSVKMSTNEIEYRVVKMPLSSFSLSLLRDNAGIGMNFINEPLGTPQGIPTEVNGSYYNPVTPVRIADTRTNSGLPFAGSTLGPGGILEIPVSGSNSIPMDSTSVVLNVTATNTTGDSYLVAYPTGSSVPETSNLNWLEGETMAGLVEVTIGDGGKIDLKNALGTTNLVVDLEGYFGPQEPGAGLYEGLMPTRIFDTRMGSGYAGQGHPIGQMSTESLNVLGIGGIPSTGVLAVSVNITVTDTSSNGYLTAYSTASAEPLTSNLNFFQGESVANEAIIGISTNGTIDISNISAGNIDVVVDLLGWYTDGSYFRAEGGGLYSITPQRIADTRPYSGYFASGNMLAPGASIVVPSLGSGTVPSWADGEILNVTVTDVTGTGYLSVSPTGSSQPVISTVNYSVSNSPVANETTLPINHAAGSVTVLNGGSTPVDIIIDLLAYYG